MFAVSMELKYEQGMDVRNCQLKAYPEAVKAVRKRFSEQRRNLVRQEAWLRVLSHGSPRVLLASPISRGAAFPKKIIGRPEPTLGRP